MLDSTFTQALLSAMDSQEPLTISYVDANDNVTERSVLVHSMYNAPLLRHRRGRASYVRATDLDKSEVRSFRLDRISIKRVEVITQEVVTYLGATGAGSWV